MYIESDEGVHFDSLSMMYEFAPLDYRGAFRCNDEEINRIWEVAAYTLHLTTREVFLDGIKRDRWVWSGDAIQSYLMNYYLFFDSNTVTRTINLLRGKDPVTSHINTIMDYTFYWFMSIYDYYLYTGDLHFIKQIYPNMVSLWISCSEEPMPMVWWKDCWAIDFLGIGPTDLWTNKANFLSNNCFSVKAYRRWRFAQASQVTKRTKRSIRL